MVPHRTPLGMAGCSEECERREGGGGEATHPSPPYPSLFHPTRPHPTPPQPSLDMLHPVSVTLKREINYVAEEMKTKVPETVCDINSSHSLPPSITPKQPPHLPHSSYTHLLHKARRGGMRRDVTQIAAPPESYTVTLSTHFRV